MIKLKHISSLTSSALVIVLLLTVIVSCGTQPENKAYSSKIDGDWVLSNFLDRVIESKSIAPHFKQKLSWDAIILRFKNDTVEIHGLLTNTRALWPKDSKSMQMGTSTGNYLFAFNETLNTIEARSTNNQDSIQYVFRKALPSDKNLFIGLDEVSNTQQLKKNFNA